MATTKAPAETGNTNREDNALGFELPDVSVLPTAFDVRPAGALGEDAVKEAAKVQKEAASKADKADGGDS